MRRLEGSIEQIYKQFIAPLIVYKPADTTIKDWHEILFHIDNRTIQHYSANKAFRIPGLFWLAPLYQVQGLGFRDLKAGQVILVRMDDREKLVDVEFFGGQGEASQVFTLSRSEWHSIAGNLTLIKGKVRVRTKRVKGVKGANK